MIVSADVAHVREIVGPRGHEEPAEDEQRAGQHGQDGAHEPAITSSRGEGVNRARGLPCWYNCRSHERRPRTLPRQGSRDAAARAFPRAR